MSEEKENETDNREEEGVNEAKECSVSKVYL